MFRRPIVLALLAMGLVATTALAAGVPTYTFHEGRFKGVRGSSLTFALRSVDGKHKLVDDFRFQTRARCKGISNRAIGNTGFEIRVRPDRTFRQRVRLRSSDTGGLGAARFEVRGRVSRSGKTTHGKLRYWLRYAFLPGQPVCKTGLRRWRSTGTPE